MAKKAYIGVHGIAKKIKKSYIGIDGVARKIKKAYIGIGGVARPCYSKGELAYYGAIDNLSVARSGIKGASVGNYALLAGGNNNGSTWYNTIDCYNSALTRIQTATLTNKKQGFGNVSFNNYALFAGGSTYTSTCYSTVDAYNYALTKTNPTSLSKARTGLASAASKTYAMFGGGLVGTTKNSTLEAYNTSLTRTIPSEQLYTTISEGAAGANNKYVLFTGGNYKRVEVYDDSLTKTYGTDLSQQRQDMASATINNCIVFGGGNSGPVGSFSASLNIVEAFNAALTRRTLTSFSQTKEYLSAASNGEYIIFGGGNSRTNSTSNMALGVDVYNIDLTKISMTGFQTGRHSYGAASVKDCIIFGGGYNYYSVSSVVEAYIQ